ncbi:hypothetical protein J3B02_000042 [Coemansia erecta]|nr:hypothetical protein J3B02_000042 [Coemansia erecta]
MSSLLNRSSNTADDTSGPASRFVDASSRILDKVIGSTGQRAQEASKELVEETAKLEHTSQQQLAATDDLIKRTHRNLETSREKLLGNAQDVSDCKDTQRQTMESLRETVDLSRKIFERIDKMKDPRDEKRIRYIREMEERSRDFENRLRKDHEEYAQMHAQRLARALQKQL